MPRQDLLLFARTIEVYISLAPVLYTRANKTCQGTIAPYMHVRDLDGR
jgi:hypothetical protein